MPSLKELKSKAMGLEPIIIVGKSGLTDSIVKEKGKKELAKELVSRTDSRIITQVGFVVVLYRE